MENKFEITKEMIEKILAEEEMNFTYAELEEIMDAELEKSPEDMDVELVEICAEILADKLNPSAGDEPSPEKTMIFPEEMPAQSVSPTSNRKVKIGKILLIAAVVGLLCAVAIPAGARFMPSEAADKIIDFCYDHFKIDLRSEKPDPVSIAEKDNDWVNNLILENLHTLKLPEVLLSDEYEKSVNVQDTENIKVILIDILNSKQVISGTIIITQYKDENVELHNGVGNVSSMYKYFEQITINDTDVLVFGNDNKFYVKYIDANTEYEVVLLNTEFDTAVKIAESIK